MTTYLANSKEELVANFLESREDLGGGYYKCDEGYSHKIKSLEKAAEIWKKTKPYLASLLLVSKINRDIKPFPDYSVESWNEVMFELLESLFAACDYEIWEEIKSAWNRGAI